MANLSTKNSRKAHVPKDKTAEKRAFVADVEAKTPPPTIPSVMPPQRPQLVARSLVAQADRELGLHTSVAAMLQSVTAEKAELKRRYDENTVIENRIIAEEIKFYNLNHDKTRPVKFNADFSVMLVPQPAQLKETVEDIPHAKAQ